MTFTFPTAVERAIHRICEDISTPRSHAVSQLLKHREWDQLVSLKVDPRQYENPHRYWLDASVTSILRKTEDLPTSFDRKAAALENFWIAERQCLRTNQRLYPIVQDLHSGVSRRHPIGPLDEFIVNARKIAASILGPCPDFVKGRFGPGATYGDKGMLTTVPDKMTSRPTLSSDAWPFLFQWSSTLWAKTSLEKRGVPEFVRGNRFTTVPKDCTKNRGIAVEPSINVFYQLGYGRVIRDRLLSFGIDLKNGQSIHRRVAREASIDGHFATLDLKNASDTVSRRLVELILPKGWFEVLSMLRSPTTEVEGKTLVLEKFSSMGNGFTFELETLIFLVICLACNPAHEAGYNVFVYGDDIIVPTESSRVVIAALEFFGLTINLEKSFTSGKFRESCGGDYFDGVDVRPFFLKETPCEPQQLISLANGLRRMGHDGLSRLARYRYLHRAWLCILDALPTRTRDCRGPEALGDLVVHDEKERWKRRWRSGIRYIGVYRPALFRRIGWEHWHPDVVLATAVYGTGDGLEGISPRDNVLGYKHGWVPYS